MKQVLQDLKTGAVTVTETPEPAPAPGRLLVRVQASLLSAGTESAQLARGRQSLLSRVRQKPELLRQGLDELKERGLAGVREKLASKFEGFSELGYSCAGTVVDNGGDAAGPAPGSLAACGGVGYANHAELVSVPVLLTAAVPEGVAAEAAAFTTVGAVALQGARQSAAQVGECVAVIGLGLVGLLTAQVLRAMGCRVAGIDLSPKALERGRACGCDVVVPPEQALEAVLGLSGGIGADAVIICAATADSGPVELAGKLARSRGRVVVVGATGMTIPWESYYRKELSFTLSRSYGPGRYDREYEEEGIDYPVDYVRFTEQRNLRAFLDLVQQGKVDPLKLITHRFPVASAPDAYAVLNDRTADRAGIVLIYPQTAVAAPRFAIDLTPAKPAGPGVVGVGFIGAGAYAQSMLLPLLKARTDVALRSVMTRAGSHALHAASRFGFETVCSRPEEVLQNPAVQLVFIATRHDSHAELACRALRAGKHVWVEKPLALSPDELKKLWCALKENPACRLVAGFNRPFSRSAAWLAGKFGAVSPRMLTYRVNAGAIPLDSWVNDPQAGGGRLLGEGCHFFDFLRAMAGNEAESVQVEPCGNGRTDLPGTANFAATVRFRNGSVGQLIYSAQGAAGLGKERFECFAGPSCGVIDDFKHADFFSGDRHESCPRHVQDKGQAALLEAMLRCVREGGPAPMRAEDLFESSVLTLAAQESLVARRLVSVAELRLLVL